LVAAKIPPPTLRQIRERLEKAAAACAKLGLTTVHDAGVSGRLDAYRELIASGGSPSAFTR
jgi:predicted amidohydrolase YtcJ